MTALTVALSSETASKIDEIARAQGLSPEALLQSMTETLIRDFDVYQQFLSMAERGQAEVDQALDLLRSTADPDGDLSRG